MHCKRCTATIDITPTYADLYVTCPHCGAKQTIESVCGCSDPSWTINGYCVECGGKKGLSYIYDKGEKMKPQRHVARATTERGYREGWTLEQFAARQVVKLIEELGELAANFRLPHTDPFDYLSANVERARWMARKTFDSSLTGYGFEDGEPCAITEARRELADLQVVIFNLADALEELGGEPFDVVQAAIEKACSDVERGVR